MHEQAREAPQGAASQERVDRFEFTGDGREYFRIWVVNQFLTIATLGLYSPWSKVRRTKYFYQNTRLDGFVFDYHADPMAILRGRLLVLAFLVPYTLSVNFSRTLATATILSLCAAAPWAFMRSQQFKLGNTSWRGLRFAFVGRMPEAYRVGLPVLALWFVPTLASQWSTPNDWAVAVVSGASLFFGFPWMHHRLKAYQHGHAWYGSQSFDFQPVTRRFYGSYAKATGLGFAAVFVMVIGFGVVRRAGSFDPDTALATSILTLLVLWLFAIPYLAARIQQAVWSTTRVGDTSFSTDIQAGALCRLVIKSVGLTLLTAGLYWPFARVALARYRIRSMSAHRPAGAPAVATIEAGTKQQNAGATSEGAADSFGLDIGF